MTKITKEDHQGYQNIKRFDRKAFNQAKTNNMVNRIMISDLNQHSLVINTTSSLLWYPNV